MHWNIEGEIDGDMGKTAGLFFIPVMALVVYIMLTFIVYIAPLKENIKKFDKEYYVFRLVFVIFLLSLYVFTLFAAFGHDLKINYFIMPAMAILFVVVAWLLKKCRRNFFIGIKTPWTLSNDMVWKKTHELGSKLFLIMAGLALVGMFFPEKIAYTFVFPLLVMVIVLFVYSAVLYKRLENKKRKKNKKKKK